MTLHTVTVGKAGVTTVKFANNLPIALMAGTCAIEGRDITMKTAEHLKKVCDRLGIGLVYKGSFDKANRTSGGTQRGLGLDEGLKILEEVRTQFGLPVLTDVHETIQVQAVADVVDVLQVPAFLSRQTDLIVACAQAAVDHPGLAVNIKKGQFMAPQDTHKAAAKVAATGSNAVLLTERGACFGYNNLVVDYRGYAIMAESGYPTVHDASHCVQMPAARGDSSGGDRKYIPLLARAAVAAGCAGIFLETHPDPASAISDKETQWPLAEVEKLLHQLKTLDDVVKGGNMADPLL